MKILVDTNRIIAALIKNSDSRGIIKESNIEFVTIGVSKEEIEKYINVIKKKSMVGDEEFKYVFNKIMINVCVLRDDLIKPFMQEAMDIMDRIDKDDTPFIAAALAANLPIWSDDKHFEKQNKIKIFKTKDLVKYIK
ncbi:hypothetical protein HY498_04680 [Candidatus Woesearchaeota archaeon]|nr:hypothetical protein [Candidatus Woesearchaeota archaeon]